MQQPISYFEQAKINILKQDLDLKNGYQVPEIFKQYALIWNSKILFPNDTKQFSYYMGSFLSVIIKLSQNQQVQTTFKQIYDQSLQQLNQNVVLLEQLVNYIFDIPEITGVPTTPEFKQIAIKLFENFEFFKQTTDKLSYFFYFNGQEITKQNDLTNYRLIISLLSNGATGIQFSTNLNPIQLYWTEFKSGVKSQTPQNVSSNQQLNVHQNTNFPSQQINNTVIQGIRVGQNQNLQQPQNQQNFTAQQFNQQINQYQYKPQDIQQPIKDSSQQNCNSQIRQISPTTQTIQSQNQQLQQPEQEEINVMSTQFANNQIEDKSAGESQRLQTSIKIKNKTTQVCEVCSESYDHINEGILSPCCEKKFHKECYLYDLSHKAEQYNFFDALRCFGCNKQLKQFKEFLKANLGQKLLPIITTEIIRNIPNNCFNCQQPIAINLQQSIDQKIICIRCKTEICRLCKQIYHGENQQNQQCPSLHKEIIKSMAGMVITVCPFCNLIQTKDEKCNHVTCSKCKKDLCAICSVDRRPILGHGNHFHREGCVDYMPWLDKNKQKCVERKNNKCELCNETGIVCAYPKSLKEYKTEKQY